ncbi:MAG: formate dehydrogenase subunit gamma [Woeseiaceae bacterium]|nr:formate dehydrogenase subunit gamma [Woeseiaceae bacterium]
MSVANGYDSKAASEIIAAHGAKPELLIQILHGFLHRFGYVSEEAVRQLADELNLSRADVHGVVHFYHDFRTEPAGKHVVKMCQAEACQAMGSRALTEHAEGTLGAKLHETHGDVTLEPVYCLGNCACSPAVMIDGRTYGRVDAERFDELVGSLGDD